MHQLADCEIKMAKRKPRTQQEKVELTYKQLARQRVENKQRRQILIGVSILSAVVLIIMSVAVVNELILKPGQPVAEVNGTTIRTDDFQERVRHERSMIINQYLQYVDLFGIEQAYQFSGVALLYGFTETAIVDNYEEFGGQVLDSMIDEILIRRAATEMGIQVSDEQVSQFIEEQYNYFRDGTPTPLPTSTPRPSPTPITPTDTLPTPFPSLTPRPSPTVVTEAAFDDLYGEQLDALDKVDVGEETLLESVEMQLLTERVREQLVADVPREVEQVNFDAMLFSTAVEASVYLMKLESGESFDDLAEQVQESLEGAASVQPSSWVPFDDIEEFYGRTVAELLFSLGVGTHSDVTATDDGRFALFRVIEREMRELSATALRSKEGELYTAWLVELRAAAQIEKQDYWFDRVPQTPALDFQALIPTPVPEQ